MTSEEIDALWTIDDPVAGLEKLERSMTENPEAADELHTQICRSLGLQGRFEDGWAELAKISAHPSETVQVRVQLESGRLTNSFGDKKGAIPYFEKALELAVETKLDFFAVDAAHMLAIATDGHESVEWNERALSMAAASKDERARKWRGSLLNNLGWTYHDAGEYASALTKFEEARDFREEAGTPQSLRIARWAIARCYRSMGRYTDALAILEDLVKFPQAGYVSEEMGENLLALGRAVEAGPHFAEAYRMLSKDDYLRDREGPRLQRMKALAG